MKKAAVIYKTKYGAAEVYAKHIADALHCDIFTLEESKKVDLSEYSAVIYGGGVHAGGIRGFDVFEKTVKKYKDKVNFTIFTCGMNVQNFEARSQLRDVNFSKSHTKGLTCYFFDGKFDPESVKGLDKGIIKWTRK
ncbi:MAG: flavodoxin domain-containing protein, partial [Clostridia bacterium]|nr:flavodoxin domain-containing protein [Clostridia bacterium]